MQNADTIAEAQEAQKFYKENYSPLKLDDLSNPDNKILLGQKPYRCRFCGGGEPQCSFRMEAHAISALLGNKSVFSLYECDQCNARFAKIEDDLGKMSMLGRSIGGVIGRKGVPKLPLLSHGRGNRPKITMTENTLSLSHDADDIGVVEDESAKKLTVKYKLQPYRPLGAYKALCKSAFSLLPAEELQYFDELRRWLFEPDLTTAMVYSGGWYICYSTFVPAWRPFGKPVAFLHRRRSDINAPYMSFFIAVGNVSYQIFLPCPAKDAKFIEKNFKTFAFPHVFHLKPELIGAALQAEIMDLSSPEQLKSEGNAISWTYENKIRME